MERLIAYENGEAIRLQIVKIDQSSFCKLTLQNSYTDILVYRNATVNHIKLAIRDFIQRSLPEGKNRISWYVRKGR